MPFLSFSSILEAVIEPQEIIEKLIPNFWDFLIQLIAFVLLIVIVFFVAYKPLKKLSAKRKEYVDENLRGSEKAKAEAEEYLKASKESVEKSKLEAKQILIDAKAGAEKEAEEILAKAQEDAQLAKRKADEEIEEAKRKSRQDVHKEIVDVAIASSEKVLGREVNKEDEKRLLDDFVNNLNEGK